MLVFFSKYNINFNLLVLRLFALWFVSCIMAATGPPAQVTGISPIEGVPGTKLTLRGEHFGKTALDLTHVFVGGIDVSPSARWFSSRKLSVITPLGIGELEIVVVTKSGGIGTSELTYTQSVGQKIGTYFSPFVLHYFKRSPVHPN